ncbi:pteridine reductase [Stenotrophomonas sp. HITSZ_GD]|uniref:pteridine reductase n=1 Tax=Stenotrophomonas sp. HITSZ_GD TaxID=3037248 RepID=UPI00240DA389|nr:pteridine reductase [Stenotrophomonas sp. HITSZ_GD]MDG2525972.1 pteridine reductase [Stenotrophomonas sp. HITSZ_GD]
MSETDKVALVTGAARRIGAAIVRRLHAAGYRVAVHAHASGPELAALCAALDTARPGSVLALQADLREATTPAALVHDTLATFGRLDALVSNASNFFPTPLETATVDQWEALMAVNARAPFLMAQAAAPALRARRGAIVHLVDAALAHPLPAHAAYTAAKGALAALTAALAVDLAPEVRVNAVAPGAILWPESGKDAAAQAAVLARTPLGRTGTPEEVAEAVRWLVEDAHYITGHTLPLDGGRLLG